MWLHLRGLGRWNCFPLLFILIITIIIMMILILILILILIPSTRAGLAESDPSKGKLKVTRRRVTFRICRLLLRQTPFPHLKKWRPRLVPIDPFLSPTSPRLVVAVCLFPFRWWWYKETLFIIIKMMQISHNYIIIICLIVILTIIFIITMVAILIMTRAQISTRMIPTQDK